MEQCQFCQGEIDAATRRCRECGRVLSRVVSPTPPSALSTTPGTPCPNCGRLVPTGARFCGDCGQPLFGSQIDVSTVPVGLRSEWPTVRADSESNLPTIAAVTGSIQAEALSVPGAPAGAQSAAPAVQSAPAGPQGGAFPAQVPGVVRGAGREAARGLGYKLLGTATSKIIAAVLAVVVVAGGGIAAVALTRQPNQSNTSAQHSPSAGGSQPTASPTATASASTLLVDDFTKDSSLNTALWIADGPVATAVIANFDSPPAQVVQPILTFSQRTGMDMQGVTGCYEQTGIQSIQSFRPPFTLTTSVIPIEIDAAPMQVIITDASGGNGLNGGGGRGGIPEYTGFAFSAPSGAGSNWTQREKFSNQAPTAGTRYTFTISVDASGQATMKVSSGAGVIGQGTWNVGQGPFYVILDQGDGAHCPVPLQADWLSIQVTA